MKLPVSGKYKYKVCNGKLMTEHRAVMMEVSPEAGADGLVIHHVDGDKSNNDPENLIWMTREEHSRLHHLGENHFPCDGKNNANYRHGMCVGERTKEYVQYHNKKSYQAHREERLAKQNAYCAEHRDEKRLYDKIRYWESQLACAIDKDRIQVCEQKLNELKGCA